LVRFTQSPSGGGDGNPAWDFQWFINRPRKDKLYRLIYRAVYKPWVDREDVLREYDQFVKSIGKD
jgi:uridine kinase